MVVMPIDMPSNCWDCPCHEDYGFCNLMIDTGDGDDQEYEYDYKLKCIPEGRDLRKNRRENCPLIDFLKPPVFNMSKEEMEELRKAIMTGGGEIGTIE